MTCRHLKAVLIHSILPVALAANTAPVVDAGPDTTARLGYIDWRFCGSVEDDGLPAVDSLKFLWTQFSGPPDGSRIRAPSSLTSIAEFTVVGDYVLRLTATDGELTSYDDVRVTVLDSIPFLVLSPHAGDRVVIGDSVLIAWQIDPPASVLISLSIDDGLSYEVIKGTQTRESSWMWVVSDSFPESENCRIEVCKYWNRVYRTTSGKFSLVHPASVKNPAASGGAISATEGAGEGCGAGALMALFPPLALRIARPRRKGQSGGPRPAPDSGQ